MEVANSDVASHCLRETKVALFIENIQLIIYYTF